MTVDPIKEHLRGIAECVLTKRSRRTFSSKSEEALSVESPECDPDEVTGSSLKDDPEGPTEDDAAEQKPVEKSITVDIAKANDEEQTVTGVVLQPEEVDGQGDIISADVIKDTAYRFLANFNRKTKLGLQHSTFPKGKLALVECYLAPMNFVLGSKTVKQGSWIMTVKVLDAKLWQKVKDGKITGFSIGGRAKVIAAEEG